MQCERRHGSGLAVDRQAHQARRGRASPDWTRHLHRRPSAGGQRVPRGHRPLAARPRAHPRLRPRGDAGHAGCGRRDHGRGRGESVQAVRRGCDGADSLLSVGHRQGAVCRRARGGGRRPRPLHRRGRRDRKSTRLNSSHGSISYAVFCLKKKMIDLVGLGGKSAADKGKDTRDYLAAAFPELNALERTGADAYYAGMIDAGFENQKELTKMQLDNQKEIAEMQNETQKEIAGIQSATSRQNTKDQVYAQNEMLAYQQKESTARVASIMENTNLSKQQQVSEI